MKEPSVFITHPVSISLTTSRNFLKGVLHIPREDPQLKVMKNAILNYILFRKVTSVSTRQVTKIQFWCYRCILTEFQANWTLISSQDCCLIVFTFV